MEERQDTTGSAAAGITGPDQFKALAVGALRRLQALPHIVRGFFADPDLSYITAAMSRPTNALLSISGAAGLPPDGRLFGSVTPGPTRESTPRHAPRQGVNLGCPQPAATAP